MAKADNLMSILWLLGSRHRITASEIAEKLEISVRTVYRYIDSLCASGIPIISEPGHDGGYQLLHQFKHAPLFFDTEERKALFYAAQFAKQAGYPYEGPLENALQKMEFQMSEDQRYELETYTSRFDIIPSGASKINDQLLRMIENAIANTKQIIIYYKKRNSTLIETRKIDPYGILHWNRKWYLIGFCHLRAETRTFRMDRLEKAEVLQSPFHRPENFSAPTYFLNWLAPRQEGNLVRLTIKSNKETLDYLKNHWQLQYYFVQQTETVIQFLVEKKALESFVPNLLISYGTSIYIKEPISLRHSLAELAKSYFHYYLEERKDESET